MTLLISILLIRKPRFLWGYLDSLINLGTDLEGSLRTIFLAFEKKISGQAGWKSRQQGKIECSAF